nr:MAG TPA: hypothetical protein [Caudoviricetes sp.]
MGAALLLLYSADNLFLVHLPHLRDFRSPNRLKTIGAKLLLKRCCRNDVWRVISCCCKI